MVGGTGYRCILWNWFCYCTALAKAGATVCFNDLNQELVDKGLKAYELGIKAYGYVCDVTDEEARINC